MLITSTVCQQLPQAPTNFLSIQTPVSANTSGIALTTSTLDT